MTSQDPGAARRGEAEDEGDRLAEGRGGRSWCSNPEARGSQHSPMRLRGTRSRAQAWVPVTMETVSPGKIGCFLGWLQCKSKPFHLHSSRYQLLCFMGLSQHKSVIKRIPFMNPATIGICSSLDGLCFAGFFFFWWVLRFCLFVLFCLVLVLCCFVGGGGKLRGSHEPRLRDYSLFCS